MKVSNGDRRVTRRHDHKTPLRVRIWKSPQPEQREESLNLSPHGVYFATNAPLREGETVEVFFTMPEEITTEPNSEWRCTGHVVRVDRTKSENGKLGVGVRFDCYEVARSQAPCEFVAPQPALGDEVP
jgi:hypothetical protein